MTTADDKALEAALARLLGPDADATAPLSRAVLTRIADQGTPHRAPLAEVLAMPLPAAGLMFGALLLAGALGYSLLPGEVEETMLIHILVGAGL